MKVTMSKYKDIDNLSKYREIMLIAALSKYFEKIDALEEKINSIENKLDMLLKDHGYNSNEDVIVVREIPYKQAKEEVINYFKIHKQGTIVDLHQNLGIPIDILIEILDELSKEGKIGD